MWLTLAFCSAALLGLYDVSKKRALVGNNVLVVLMLNTLFSALLFLPFIVNSTFDCGWFGSELTLPSGDLDAHLLVLLKSVIVLTSWIFGYYGMKHLPLTIVGPINATRPVMVLVGAMVIFGERLNMLQWIGVLLAIFSLFLLSRVGRKEGVHFGSNIWILSIAAAAVTGACSGLYDKYIITQLEPLFVQSWYTLYQFLMMTITVAIVSQTKYGSNSKFHWSWAIPLIAIFLSLADVAYLSALNSEGAMIAIVSMIRRGSVVVSFGFGAMLFREKNLRAKALDLVLIFIGMLFLYFGSR